MNPSEFYHDLITSIKEDDVYTIANILADHVGQENAITLKDLAVKAFGEFTVSTERKTRELLEQLTKDHHLPVCSFSGKSGRWLAANDEEKENAAAELEARGRNTLERARALRLSVVPAKTLKRERETQMSMWR